jgi:hypothetical protein
MNNYPMAHIVRPFAQLLTVGLLATNLFGCSLLTETETNGVYTDTFYPDDILVSLENVFADCNDPLVFTSGMDEVDLAGNCEISDVEGDEQLILAGLISQGSMDLGAPLPSAIDSTTEVIDGLSWPFQNCEVTFQSDVYFESIEMTDLRAWWSKSGGKPRLRVDLDFGKDAVGHVDMSVNVSCPSSLSEWLVKAFTQKLRNEVNGSHTIYTYNRDLDLTFNLDHDEDNILADLNVDFEVGNLYVDIDWSKVENLKVLWWTIEVTDGAEVEEDARSYFESEVGGLLNSSLGSLEDTVVSTIEMGLPGGEVICDIDVENKDLVVTTSSSNGTNPCMVAVKAQKYVGFGKPTF